MTKKQYYFGHLVYIHDIKEIDQAAQYEDISIEEATKRYCCKDCPCKSRFYAT